MGFLSKFFRKENKVSKNTIKNQNNSEVRKKYVKKKQQSKINYIDELIVHPKNAGDKVTGQITILYKKYHGKTFHEGDDFKVFTELDFLDNILFMVSKITPSSASIF